MKCERGVFHNFAFMTQFMAQNDCVVCPKKFVLDSFDLYIPEEEVEGGIYTELVFLNQLYNKYTKRLRKAKFCYGWFI